MSKEHPTPQEDHEAGHHDALPQLTVCGICVDEHRLRQLMKAPVKYVDKEVEASIEARSVDAQLAELAKTSGVIVTPYVEPEEKKPAPKPAPKRR